jgi:hypothetical protein
LRLQTVEVTCNCGHPANPDKTLLGCTSESCKKWLHEECIKEEALKATYERLGTDKPHISEAAPKDSKKEEEETKRPLSPTESGAAVSAQHSIDVKSGKDTETGGETVKDNVDVGVADDEDPFAVPDDAAPESGDKAAAEKDKVQSETAGKSLAGKSGPGRKPGKSRKKATENGNADSHPYDGLFKVTLRMQENIPVLDFEDLRDGIVGGDKTWTERVNCLVCGAQIN